MLSTPSKIVYVDKAALMLEIDRLQGLAIHHRKLAEISG
jgi:hypothetical protein